MSEYRLPRTLSRMSDCSTALRDADGASMTSTPSLEYSEDTSATVPKMKRKAPCEPETKQSKRPRVGSTRYPGLRAPPQRTLTPRLFQSAVTIGPSRLEGLPPEIRNQIYELVLVDKDRPTKVRQTHCFDDETRIHSLMQVSRSIRAECLQMYYSANTFRFRSLLHLSKWFETIMPDCRFVKKVELAVGVIEGRHLTYKARELAMRPPTRTEFTYRIAKNVPSVFHTGYDIHPETRELALEKLAKVGKFMTEKVEDVLVIEGLVPHCPICSNGTRWTCGMENWWEN